MNLPFIKMHGLGNDYVYIDCFPPEISAYVTLADVPDLARRISDRHHGIGSDGLVLILPSDQADAMMRIFNADGSEAQMCGNAIRCVGKYLYESGLCKRLRMEIMTLAGLRSMELKVEKGVVSEATVNMGVPIITPRTLLSGADPIGYTFVNMGNPHAVFFREALSPMPTDINVELVRVRTRHELDVHVWERGSGATQACGTGACATAVAAIRQQLTDRTVTVHLPGGDLFIRWAADNEPVYMTGSATEVFRGEYPIADHDKK